jgi:hypothetical protein
LQSKEHIKTTINKDGALPQGVFLNDREQEMNDFGTTLERS